MEEEYKPKIYKRITERGTVELTVEHPEWGWLSIEIDCGEGFSLVYDRESGLALRLPEEIFKEAVIAESEEDLWKIWNKIAELENKFKEKLLDFQRKLYVEKISGILEIMERALRGEEVQIDADFFVLERIMKTSEILLAKVSACVNGFWLTCYGKREVQKFFKAPDLFKILYEARAEPADRAEKRAFGAYDL